MPIEDDGLELEDAEIIMSDGEIPSRPSMRVGSIYNLSEWRDHLCSTDLFHKHTMRRSFHRLFMSAEEDYGTTASSFCRFGFRAYCDKALYTYLSKTTLVVPGPPRPRRSAAAERRHVRVAGLDYSVLTSDLEVGFVLKISVKRQ